MLGLPKGTVRTGSAADGVRPLARDVNEKQLCGRACLRKLALDTLNHGSLRGMREVTRRDLVEQVGETCTSPRLDGADVLYLDRVEAPWPWRLTLDVEAHVLPDRQRKLFLAPDG
jgi:hypothetical protein